MARNLYSMKMFMFAEQLEYDEEKCCEAGTPQPSRTVLYTHVDVIYTCCRCPANDLQFMKDIYEVQEKTDPEIAQAVLQKLENHKWYRHRRLCRSLFFGSRLSDPKRSRTLLPSCTP
ncbi:hypothetical protein GWK47_043871 [Chionoecetes opilio]|uniref:Uncharacterized protein n=1 Tax=Chionoecetes opilio TaxID=41210 RepID=A0A8J5CJ44_CHIOP|nr:hypothetical protein GWK47_043871 [Chionoecetes opilio]